MSSDDRELIEKLEKYNGNFNGAVRVMSNGHWSIPFSSAFVMKNIENFDATTCTIEVSFTMIIRIKFAGLPEMNKIMDWVLAKLKIRVNEVEGPLLDGENRSGKVNKVKSSEWKEGDDKDMIQYTLRCKQLFYSEFDQYKSFPFDNL